MAFSTTMLFLLLCKLIQFQNHVNFGQSSESHIVTIVKPFPTFLPWASCILSVLTQHLHAQTINEQSFRLTEHAPAATALESERTGNMPSCSVTAVLWCLEIEGRVQRNGSWLELGVRALSNLLLPYWGKKLHIKMNMGIGHDLCGREISASKESLVWPWSGNISFEAE